MENFLNEIISTRIPPGIFVGALIVVILATMFLGNIVFGFLATLAGSKFYAPSMHEYLAIVAERFTVIGIILAWIIVHGFVAVALIWGMVYAWKALVS